MRRHGGRHGGTEFEFDGIAEEKRIGRFAGPDERFAGLQARQLLGSEGEQSSDEARMLANSRPRN